MTTGDPGFHARWRAAPFSPRNQLVEQDMSSLIGLRGDGSYLRPRHRGPDDTKGRGEGRSAKRPLETRRILTGPEICLEVDPQ